MDEMQIFIADLTATALTNWAAGIESPLFPPSEDTQKFRANIFWNIALNSMAYGYERGMGRGCQMAKAEAD